MKHLITSVTIGACLLLSSAGDVFAHSPPVTTGQKGTGGTGAASCGGAQTSPPGQTTNTTTQSPFPASGGAVGSSAGTYAGSPNGPGNYGAGAGTTGTRNTAANSQYDLACLQQQMH
jgi:hypothetical protein